jgi:rare lipoprotein A (peptidoglycan hydrolase)
LRHTTGHPTHVTLFCALVPKRETHRYLVSALLGLLGSCLISSGKAQACSLAGTTETGVASYYGPGFNGDVTASGQVFNMNAMTAAHPCLPMGTKIRVTLVRSGRSLIVTINDRMPSHRRILDLSVGAARALGILGQGIAMVELAPAG